jgi:AraC family transcriptional regulator
VTVASVRAREQITGIVGGQIVAATDAPLLTSATTPWSGFLLEKHDAAGRQDVCWGWHRTHVALFTKGTLAFQINEPANRQDFVARAGSVCIFPSGFDETNFSLTGSKFEAIVVELDPVRLERFAKSHTAVGALTPQIVVEDTQIAALLTIMASEVAERCPNGPLYGESLSLALATYLSGRFSVKGREGKPLRKFSEVEARRVMDYIHANLHGPLNIFELAELIQLSPRQFIRIFSNTFGTTPHRYIINKRVALAKELIAKGRLLVDIAGKLGFASQSHFSGVFRKVTGMSPGQFRQDARL